MAAALTLFGVVLTVLLPFRATRIRLSGHAGHIVGRGVLWALGIRSTIEGAEKLEGPAIIVANHTSHLDMFLAASAAPVGVCFIARRGLLLFPLLGALFALSGHLLIPRGRTGAAVRALNREAAFVKRNALGMWIWPEGTRSADGRLRPRFKKGFVHLAIETGLPVVVGVITGAHTAWPKGHPPRSGQRVRMEFLPAVHTETWRAETAADHAAEIQALVEGALPEAQRPA